MYLKIFKSFFLRHLKLQDLYCQLAFFIVFFFFVFGLTRFWINSLRKHFWNTPTVEWVCKQACEREIVLTSLKIKDNDKYKSWTREITFFVVSHPSNMAPNFFATWDWNSGVVPSSFPSCSCFETSTLCNKVKQTHDKITTETLSQSLNTDSPTTLSVVFCICVNWIKAALS